MLWHIVFFSFGYIFHKHESLFTPYRHFWGMISILFFLIAIPFWHFGTPFTFLENLSLPFEYKKILYLIYNILSLSLAFYLSIIFLIFLLPENYMPNLSYIWLLSH